MDVLKKLFEQHFHSPVESSAAAGPTGRVGAKDHPAGQRRISAIGVLYDVREENAAFLEFSRHFRAHGLPVPEIYAEDLSQGAYLEEDLGDTTLFEFLSKNRSAETIGSSGG
jgi:aminoglycoside/choline kinase family phosphotransferase